MTSRYFGYSPKGHTAVIRSVDFDVRPGVRFCISRVYKCAGCWSGGSVYWVHVECIQVGMASSLGRYFSFHGLFVAMTKSHTYMDAIPRMYNIHILYVRYMDKDLSPNQ